MPRLNLATRNIVIGRLQARQSQNKVARTLNVNQSTISRLWNRFLQTGSSIDLPRSGRPRIASPGPDLYIRVFHIRNRTVSASTTAVGIPGLRRIRYANSPQPASTVWHYTQKAIFRSGIDAVTQT